ncbi:Msa family membrane protein [Streptococcus sp. H49]|uniref:Msa family membrane protein n=1 Tax=Streptococcus huangxiaojuni TaxID=3237239 RepID=UPI0034A180B7
MTLLFIAAIIYIILTLAGSHFLLALSASSFALLVYVLPLVLNFLVTKVQKTDKQKLIASVVCPTLSLLYYIGLTYLSSSSGVWSKFVEVNSVANSSVSMEITKTPLAASQLIFVALVFYGVSLAAYFIAKSSVSRNKGVQHA